MIVPVGVWLIAGTAVGQPYPCRCAERGGRDCGRAWCPCWGRRDLATAGRILPWSCCGWRSLDALVTHH